MSAACGGVEDYAAKLSFLGRLVAQVSVNVLGSCENVGSRCHHYCRCYRHCG